MPVGAFGGRREIMEKIAPLGPVYQAGTLSGNPVAVAAGLATLELIAGAGLLRRARRATTRASPTASRRRRATPASRSARSRSAACSASISRATVPDSYDEVMACDKERFNRFFHAMLDAASTSRRRRSRPASCRRRTRRPTSPRRSPARPRRSPRLAKAAACPSCPTSSSTGKRSPRASSARRSMRVVLEESVRAAHRRSRRSQHSRAARVRDVAPPRQAHRARVRRRVFLVCT